MATRKADNRRPSRVRPRDSMRELRRSDVIQPAMSKGTKVQSQYQPLTEHEVVQIHQSALNVLEKVGIASPTPRVQDVAISNGCLLNDSGRLKFPRSLVDDALASAAKNFTVHGRKSEYDFQLSTETVNFCTDGAAVSMLDIETREYRPSVLTDLYDLARLCDTLENIQWFTRPVVCTDINDVYELDVNTIYACAAGTQKHIATSITKGEHVYRMLPMLDLIGGGDGAFAKRPYLTVHATNIVSPLTFAEESLDVTCAAVNIGMPIHSQTGPQAGATAPAALAGTLVQGCAESLASLTVINLLNPGHPVIMGNWGFVSDLRTSAFSGGGGEQALLGAAIGQMATFYGIPGGCGAGMTDSKIPDNQAGFEKSMTMLTAALSGGGLVYELAGMLASLLGCSFESMIIDDDMLSCLRRIARGIEVNDETLSLSVIEESVEGPGHFLGHAQTMELMESEFVYTQIANIQSPSDWKQAGALDSWERATLKAKKILNNYYPQYIDPRLDSAIRRNFPIHLQSN